MQKTLVRKLKSVMPKQSPVDTQDHAERVAEVVERARKYHARLRKGGYVR